MIQNRFFKTTVGIPFELAAGSVPKDATANPTFATFVTGADVSSYQAFANDGSKILKGLTFGTPLTAAQKKQMITIAYVTEKSGGVCTVISPTPMIGESIVAVNTPYKAPTLQDAKIVKNAGTINLNQELVLKVVETTPLSNLLPVYDYTSKVTLSAVASLADLAAQINAGKSDEFFTAVAITDGIQVISKDANRHFRLAMNVIPTRAFPINDTNWLYTVTTPAFAGSGTIAQIRQLEYEAAIKRGITTQYPAGGMAPGDFGSNASPLDAMVALGSTTFDVVNLTGTKHEISPTPIEIHHNKAFLFIVVPAGQGAAIAATFA